MKLHFIVLLCVLLSACDFLDMEFTCPEEHCVVTTGCDSLVKWQEECNTVTGKCKETELYNCVDVNPPRCNGDYAVFPMCGDGDCGIHETNCKEEDSRYTCVMVQASGVDRPYPKCTIPEQPDTVTYVDEPEVECETNADCAEGQVKCISLTEYKSYECQEGLCYYADFRCNGNFTCQDTPSGGSCVGEGRMRRMQRPPFVRLYSN